jgi:glycerophosphoryl diester phosphodiesterase
MSDPDAFRPPPAILARHGARTHVAANTVDAFRLALRLGADGLALDAWCLDAGPAVVATAATVRRGLRRRAVKALDPADLPPDVVTVAEVVAASPPGTVLLMTVDGLETARRVIEAVGGARLGDLWLASNDAPELVSLRPGAPGVKLLGRTRLARLKSGPERHAATLADLGADGVVLPHVDWTGGLRALYHRFELMAVADDAQHERVLRDLVRMGVDAVVTDWPDRAVDARVPRPPE